MAAHKESVQSQNTVFFLVDIQIWIDILWANMTKKETFN